jgi:hypothetical protein
MPLTDGPMSGRAAPIRETGAPLSGRLAAIDAIPPPMSEKEAGLSEKGAPMSEERGPVPTSDGPMSERPVPLKEIRWPMSVRDALVCSCTRARRLKPTRLGFRNVTRSRTADTRVGTTGVFVRRRPHSATSRRNTRPSAELASEDHYCADENSFFHDDVVPDVSVSDDDHRVLPRVARQARRDPVLWRSAHLRGLGSTAEG